MVRRGQSTFTVGTEQLSAAAGQTVFVPAGTPHTFRTLAPDRYESLAIHVSPAFISELLEVGNDFSRHEQTVAELDASSGVTYPRNAAPAMSSDPPSPTDRRVGNFRRHTWGILVIGDISSATAERAAYALR